MSLINQVLRDLEKRGSHMPDPVATSIRPVPAQPGWSKLARRLGGIVALAAVLGGALLVLGRTPEPALAALATQSTPRPAVQQIAVLPASTVLSASVVPSTLAVIPLQSGTTSAVVETASEVTGSPVSNSPAEHLGTGLAATPLPGSQSNTNQRASQEDASIKQGQPAHSSQKKAVKRRATNTEVGSQKNSPVKRFSTQQQAESEFNRAVELIQQSHKGMAQQHLESALQLNPDHGQARRALVGLLLENKRNADAERVLQDGLRANPKELDFAVLLARLQVDRNALPQALDTLQKMQPYAGEQANYHAFLAAVFQRLNRHKEAVVHYQTALRQTPNSGVWLMGMGISLQALKRNEEARDAFRRAIESHSLSAELQDFVGRRMKAL